MDMDQINNVVHAVQGALTDDLRKPQYRGRENCLAGHCYVASEALYHLLGGKKSGWKPMHVNHEGGPHWYLQHSLSGTIIDPTASQFTTPIPYENGRGKGFLTGDQPSKRTQVVLERVAKGPHIAKAESEDLAKAIDYNTPEFKQWFAGSKIVNPDGTPLKVYHGTSKDTDFSSFKSGARGSWFTSDPEAASSYARENDSKDTKYDPFTRKFYDINTSPRVIPVHLSIKNPYKMTHEDLNARKYAENYAKFQRNLFNKLRLGGYDGVDFGNGNYVAFHPHQIKSVFNNKPSDKSHILKSEDLEKARPGFRFPKLGLPDDRRETPIIDSPRQLDIKSRALANEYLRGDLYDPKNASTPPISSVKNKVMNPKNPGQNRKIWEYFLANKDGIRDHIRKVYSAPSKTSAGSTSTLGSPLGYALNNKMRAQMVDEIDPHKTLRYRRKVDASNNADFSTKLHEDMHLMLNRVQQKYGMQGRANVVDNLLQDLQTHQPEAYKALSAYIQKRVRNNSHAFKEEHLTTLLNYLNNPGERDAYHTAAGLTPKQQIWHSNAMKAAYKHLWNTTQTRVDPTWALDPATRKKLEQAKSKVTKSEESETKESAPLKESCSVAIFNTKGFLLMGERNDSKKWTLPGGKMNRGETHEECARREVLEEAGLKIDSLQFLGKGAGGKDGEWTIYSYIAECDDKPDSSNDPDHEVKQWEWVDARDGLPEKIKGSLHYGDNDVTLRLLGLLDGADLLQKSWKHAFAGAIAAAGLAAGAPAPAQAAAAHKNVHQTESKWSPKVLHEDLLPIAHLESNFGQNVHHAQHHLGEFHTAVGAVGLKPVTAHEEYTKSSWLQKVFPNLQDPAKFTKALKKNHSLYNHVASAHWLRLKKIFNDDRVKAAYAWRWGRGAAQQKAPEVISADPYVMAYQKLWDEGHSPKPAAVATKKALGKSEVEDWLAKSTRVWRSKDGISIPAKGTPDRESYDQRFVSAVHDAFGSGVGKTLRPLKLKIDQVSRSSGNMPVVKDRLDLYTRMARAGERLPPIVVRRNSGGKFDMVDGNHRVAAAEAARVKDLDALEIVEGPAKQQKGLPKGLKLYNLGEDPQELMTPVVRQTDYGQFFEPVEMPDVEKKLKRMGYHGYHGHARNPDDYVLLPGVKLPTVEAHAKKKG